MSELAIREGWEYDDYVRAWHELNSRANWLRGDLACGVETKGTYGEGTLERYALDVGVEYSTVRAYKQVAQAYPAESVPRGTHSWTVYRELAAQPDRLELVVSRDDWTVAEARELVAARKNPMLTLYTHTGEAVSVPQSKAEPTFNETTGEGISWAAWSWNPVTGCLHGCKYCYARAITNRFRDQFPAGSDGFTPLFRSDRLSAPKNTAIPARYRDEWHGECGNGECQVCAYRRVFVCSMADLYGRWVPDDWIAQVHEAMLASPDR